MGAGPQRFEPGFGRGFFNGLLTMAAQHRTPDARCPMIPRPAALLACALALSACAPQRLPVLAQASAYRLGPGDKLRITVFGQPDLSNLYALDGRGALSMPLIGDVAAQGLTTPELEAAVAGRLRAGFLRAPSVSVQVESYRPVFVLGEVNAAGQYAYVNGLTGEMAAALAGGFTARASRSRVIVTRRIEGRLVRGGVGPQDPILPGDIVYVPERFF